MNALQGNASSSVSVIMNGMLNLLDSHQILRLCVHSLDKEAISRMLRPSKCTVDPSSSLYVDTPNLSDTNLSNSFQKVSSPDLQDVNMGIKNLFSFAEVQKRLTAFCAKLASAEFYQSTSDSVKKEIQSWNEYDAKSHSSMENTAFAKNTIYSFRGHLQSDINQAKGDICTINSNARRKRKHGFMKILGVAAALTLVSAPLGLVTLGAGAASSRHGGGGDTGSLERMIRNDQGLISELDSILRLFFHICCHKQ